ncbi:helix-turn-helix domain-containing protein [Tunturiibacter lichenicola]|uniref:helix-turn-helix domain-containing protein n=1 Tax=Tunturiibacter lichenicola TaxID=2051959 RepID=UPI003D9B114A
MQDSLFEIKLPLVNGSRVKQARELLGLTQASLAEAVYVDQTMIAHIERGNKQPTADLLDTMAELLGFPPAFFRQQDCVEMSKGSLLFRSKAVIGKKVIAQAHEYSRLSLELALRLANYAKLIPVNVPSFRDPIEAARELRISLNLPMGPVEEVIRGIERLGVLVLPLPEIRDCDAFATWAGPERAIPVIAISAGRPVDRLRLSAAHELGHLTLHRTLHIASKENEEEAYAFAAEFLMPAADIYSDFTAQKISLFRLAELKAKWRISMQALLRRSRQLQITNDRQYRYLMMQISQRGWRLEEPSFNAIAERPRALRKISEVAFGGSDSWERLAKEFNLSTSLVSAILGACDPPKEKVGQPAEERRSNANNLVTFERRAI